MTNRLGVWILVVVLLIGAVVAGALALRDDRAPAPTSEATSEPGLATPLWSVRRFPGVAREELGAARLDFELALLLGDVESCVVVDESDRTLVAQGAGTALIPASAAKLATGLGALAVLGPDHRFATSSVAAAPPAHGEVAALYLVGGGDPLLATPEYQAFLAGDPRWRDHPTTSLAELADEIVAAGVQSVPGGVVGDDSHQETVRFLPGWESDYAAQGQVGPLGALTVNHGYASWEGGNVPVADPALHAAQQLTGLLEARGVEVGSAGTGTAPPDATTIAAIQSPPLAEIVAGMERASDNLASEVLLREIGLAARGEATTTAGAEVVSDTLGELGVDPIPTIVDGSGLDRADRTTCEALLDELDATGNAELRAVDEGLAVAGVSGTLAERLRGTELEGRLRAKTGTLSGVTALVGFLTTPEGRELEFAFLANDAFSEDEGDAIADEVATRLAVYPDAPPADELVPAP